MIVVCLPSLKPIIEGLGISITSTIDKSHSKRAWVYDSYGSNKKIPAEKGVAAFVHTGSLDGSQIELRKLEGGILKTSPITVE